MGRFFLLGWILFLALTGTIIICRAIGHIQKSAALQSHQSFICESGEFCWNSIYPGTTSLDEAKTILSRTGFVFVEQSTYPLCWTKQDLGTICVFQNLINNEEPVVAVELYPEDLRLGEAVMLFGNPISAYLCVVGNGLNPYVQASVYFSKNILGYAELPTGYLQQHFQPDMIIRKIAFFNFPIPLYQSHAFPWKGFASQSIVGGCGNPPEHQWY